VDTGVNISRVATIFAILTLYNANAQVNVAASRVPLQNLTMDDRTMNILAALAEKYHVVIRVSGTLVGSDSGRISISVKRGTLADILNAIVSQDQRFEWHQADDGSLQISTRESPPAVLGVLIPSFDAERLGRMEAVPLLTQVPAIREWLGVHHCSMDEMIVGHPPKDWDQFSIHVSDRSLAAVLDEIAARSRTYFWMAMQYSREPCEINLRP
jgi:hypothetical protein